MRVILVKVRPNGRESALEALGDGSFSATLKSPPVDGKANACLIAFLAAQLGIAKSAIRLLSGDTSRAKRVRISGVDPASVRRSFLPDD